MPTFGAPLQIFGAAKQAQLQQERVKTAAQGGCFGRVGAVLKSRQQARRQAALLPTQAGLQKSNSSLPISFTSSEAVVILILYQVSVSFIKC